MKTALLFNCNENLGKALSFLNIHTVHVPADKQNCSLDQLLTLREDARLTLQCSASFDEEMIVFVDFEEEELDMTLNLLRSTGNSHILKAIMTPTNRSWPATLLYRELCSERKAIEQMNRK